MKLRATAVRVGMRVVLVPVDQPMPNDVAVVYGPATRDAVYDTFYRDTHCPNGHVRDGNRRQVQYRGKLRDYCAPCVDDRSRGETVTDWTWGEPA